MSKPKPVSIDTKKVYTVGKPKIYETEEMELIRTYQMEGRTPLNELDDLEPEERLDRRKNRAVNQAR